MTLLQMLRMHALTVKVVKKEKESPRAFFQLVEKPALEISPKQVFCHPGENKGKKR